MKMHGLLRFGKGIPTPRDLCFVGPLIVIAVGTCPFVVAP